MSKSLRTIFIVHAVVALLFGVPLLAAPGRFLGLFGWAPVDPLLSRLLGAALIALAWSSYRGFRAAERRAGGAAAGDRGHLLRPGSVGMLRHMWGYAWPWYVWTLLLVFIIFAIAWLWALRKR